MRILRYPWTSSLIETLHSRIFELYMTQKFPAESIDYLGRDFPLSTENENRNSFCNQIVFTGTLTQNPFRFLDQMTEISGLIGVQLGIRGSVAHKELGIRNLFQSETFCRELQTHYVGCRDYETKRFLDSYEIPSVLIGCVSSLLSNLNSEEHINQTNHKILLIDLTPDLEKSFVESIFDDMNYISITTKISEIYGEVYRTSMADQLLRQMRGSEIIITSNIDLAIPALALKKKTLLIDQTEFTDEFLKDFVTTVDVGRIVSGISWPEIEKLLNLVPPKNLEQMASDIEGLIFKSLRMTPVKKPKSSVTAFKEQVLSEVINSQIMRIKVVEQQLEDLFNSRSWKLTVLLRMIADWFRKFSQLLRSRSVG